MTVSPCPEGVTVSGEICITFPDPQISDNYSVITHNRESEFEFLWHARNISFFDYFKNNFTLRVPIYHLVLQNYKQMATLKIKSDPIFLLEINIKL